MLRVHDHVEQVAVVHSLAGLLQRPEWVDSFLFIIIYSFFVVVSLCIFRVFPVIAYLLSPPLTTTPTPPNTRYSRVRLVVLDSVAFHFRQDQDDFSTRLRLLTSMAGAVGAGGGGRWVGFMVQKRRRSMERC